MIQFAANLLIVMPIAIGLMPLLGFAKAIRLAPKKLGRTNWGILPGNMIRFIKLTRDSRSFSDSSPKTSLVMSSKCWGRNPSGPPAEPFLNDRIAYSRLAFVTFKLRLP